MIIRHYFRELVVHSYTAETFDDVEKDDKPVVALLMAMDDDEDGTKEIPKRGYFFKKFGGADEVYYIVKGDMR